MISGTIRYRRDDATLAQVALDAAQPMPLWKATLVTVGFGAAMGAALTEIAKPLLAPLIDASAAMPWVALFGAIVAVTGGAWRLSTKATAEPRPQDFRIDEDGLHLITDSAESLMRWNHFTRMSVTGDFVALRTQENTLVVFRPDFVAGPAEWQALLAMLKGHVAAAAQIPAAGGTS